MTKYEITFTLVFGSVMVFLINANFQNIIWEFVYFDSRLIAFLIAVLVMIERAKSSYERKLATLMKALFLIICGWEILAAISWDLANTKGVYLALFVCILILLSNLADWLQKHKGDERKNRYKK